MTLRGLRGGGGFATLGRAAVVLTGGATVFGFAGKLWWFFDLFAHFRPQYLVAGVLLVVILLFGRQPRWAAAALIIATLNAAHIVPLYLQPVQVARPVPAGSLRLMSFNIHAPNEQHQRVLRYLQNELPDVLVLLEVTPAWESTVRALATQYPYQWVHVAGDTSGIAMMSREPPSAAATIDLAERGALAYVLTFTAGDSALSVLGAHLNWPLGARATETRDSQLAAIAQIARERAPLVVMADLNTTPFSPRFAPALRDGELQRCVPGTGLTPTWPARIVPLYIQIDHCLATAGVQAWDFRVGEFLGSDHYPISVEVAPMPSSPPISLR
jgi:endonuclease/exonuclease/phosphatase (EEP) superfamily protein YafD